MKMFGSVLGNLLVLFVVCGIARPGWSQETKRIRFAVTNPPHFLPIWLAKDAGIFSKHGLDVEVIFMRGGSLITVGIMSGELQLSGVGRNRSSRRGLKGAMSCSLPVPWIPISSI